MTEDFAAKLKQYLDEQIEIEESLEKLADFDRALEVAERELNDRRNHETTTDKI